MVQQTLLIIYLKCDYKKYSIICVDYIQLFDLYKI